MLHDIQFQISAFVPDRLFYVRILTGRGDDRKRAVRKKKRFLHLTSHFPPAEVRPVQVNGMRSCLPTPANPPQCLEPAAPPAA